MASPIARRSARTLLSLLRTAEETERVEHELEAVRAILAKVPQMGRLLAHPGVPLDRRKALLEETLDRIDCHPASRGTVLFLLEQRSLASLGDLIDTFRRLKERKLGIASAVVTTVVPAAEADRPAWEAALSRATGRQVRVAFNTDPSLIGGAVAKVGSVLYDGSVLGSLERIRQSLLGD